jgi:hypothetical protein
MRPLRSAFLLPVLAFAGLCSALLLAGCGGGGTPSTTIAPTLTFAPIATHTFGDAPFTVSASSASSGAITYAVVSGPAGMSGNTVTLTGGGTVVLSATQVAAGNYSSAATSTSFSVGPETASMSINTVPAKVFGAAPFPLTATTISDGAITYTVTSGPATVSGSILTLTGAGTVSLSATQAATPSYTASSATTSFLVSQGTTTLTFAQIATQLAGNLPFNVVATSASTTAVTYTVQAGSPATISGNTVTLTGAPGTVTLNASQAGTTMYALATATTSFSVVTTGTVAGTSFTGTVQATGLPVIGASVQLYEAGTSGNGTLSNAALATALTTDASGNFTVPSSFSCIAANTALFLVAKGGKVSSTGTVNSSLWLAAALPPCGSLTAATNFTVNELTTVATAEALAQFYSAGGNIGATASNTLGLDNAIGSEAQLANIFTGVSPGASVPANVAVSSAKLNSLANVLAACAVSSTACTPLFSAATVNSVVPSNTLDAAFAIARNPGTHVAAVYALSTGTTFTPVLSAAPPDWLMFITITGGGLSKPTALGVDASGNLWSANYNNVLSKFAPNGSTSFASGITGSGLHESYGMTIDANSNIWVENDETPGSPNNGGTIAEFNNAGSPITSGIGYTAGIYFPTGIASDTNGDMWISNYGNSTYALYSNSGTHITTNCNPNACGYGQLEFPVAVAVDSNHVAWFGNQADNTVTRVSLDGTSIIKFVCCDGASGMAVDAQNNVWIANYFGDSISEISSAGVVISTGYHNGGVEHPQGIAVDGVGTIWVANYLGSSLSALAGANASTPGAGISPSTGYGTDANVTEPFAVALDASGNAWLSSYANNAIIEFLGVAAPIKTPLVGPAQAP